MGKIFLYYTNANVYLKINDEKNLIIKKCSNFIENDVFINNFQTVEFFSDLLKPIKCLPTFFKKSLFLYSKPLVNSSYIHKIIFVNNLNLNLFIVNEIDKYVAYFKNHLLIIININKMELINIQNHKLISYKYIDFIEFITNDYKQEIKNYLKKYFENNLVNKCVITGEYEQNYQIVKFINLKINLKCYFYSNYSNFIQNILFK